MTGRGTGKKRGRPPKTQTMERPNKFNYHLMKKPKYLSKRGSDSQVSTPTPSRASSPLDSESSRRSIAKPSTSKRGRPKGSKSTRGKRRGGGNQSTRPTYQKKCKYFCYSINSSMNEIHLFDQSQINLKRFHYLLSSNI